MADHPYTQDRELSWLAFNDRVLSEAMDETVPLLERLKFAAIFTSNLDEFFMIRVGSLFDLENIKPDTHDVRSGMTPKEQLEAIYKAVRPLYRKREHICSLLSQRLRAEGVRRMDPSKLSGEERDYCARYFDTCMEPVISPQIVDNLHPFPTSRTIFCTSAHGSSARAARCSRSCPCRRRSPPCSICRARS